jgi:hypothetical protein
MLRARVNVALSLVLAAGCGGGSGGHEGNGAGSDGIGGTENAGGATGLGGNGPIFNGGDGNIGLGGSSNEPHEILSLRIEPADAVLDVSVGSSIQQAFTAHAVFADAPGQEVDITGQAVFYVPDNYLVASFPEDGSSTLTTRVPAPGTAEPAQRGGSLTVQAQAANEDGTIATATTSLTVRLTGAREPADPYGPYATPALPDDPASAFTGEPVVARAPELVYPNDGVLLPPNLGRLEVHFRPGAAENELFQVRFQSEVSDLVYFTRCYASAQDFEPGACTFFLEGADLELLASSNQGRGPVTLSVRGSDEAGAFGESASFEIEFAEKRIDGAVYYWSASAPPTIMRFDFGSAAAEPEVFVRADSIPAAKRGGSTCVGCHSLSRQGDKVIFGLGSVPTARLVYVDDMSRAITDEDFFTYTGQGSDPNAVANGSFNPDGSQFVAVQPAATGVDAEASLHFHDGASGARVSQLDLPVVPNNPDWSPSGDKIAFSAIGGADIWRIRFMGSGISYIQRSGDVWDAEHPVALVPAVSGKNRFNPTFFPGGELLLFSEVDDESYSDAAAGACSASTADGAGTLCNGYSDPGARTWAVAAQPGSTPVLLARAAAPGVADELAAAPPQSGVAKADLMDTFPKPSPFEITHRGSSLGWFTVGSQRRAGLRRKFENQSIVTGEPDSQALLWMFAVDTGRVKAGEDGSYPGFFLPFQDLKTSNHMAQWTERIVSDAPPPPAPTPPPPAPPPIPILR